MATGDIKNNLGKLQSELRAVNFNDADFEQLSRGVPQAYLPIYHHVLMNYSKSLAEKISDIGVELYGKSDMRFIEAMYKVLRELFAYKPPLTKEQFFNPGYSEKKVIMCSAIVGMIKNFHKDSNPKKPKTAKSTKSSFSAAVATAGAVGITMSHNAKTSTKPVTAFTRPIQKSAKELKHGDKMELRTHIVPVISNHKLAGNQETLSQSVQSAFGRLDSGDSSGEVVNLSAIDPTSPVKNFTCTPISDGMDHPPINIIASTPCPPMKDIRPQIVEKHEYTGQLNHILKQMQEIQNKIVCIEDRMAAMEDRLNAAELTAPAQTSPAPGTTENLFDPLKLDNLQARMTVLEHRVAILDAKPDVIKQASASLTGSAQQNSVNDNIPQKSELTGTAGLTKPYESLENTEQNDSENIMVDENESKKSDKKTSSPIQTAAFKSLHLHEEFESSPSPIPMKRLPSRMFEQGSLYLTKDASSFGELNLGKVEIESFGMETSQESNSKILNQKQRIAAMMNETEKMLNMNGNAELAGGQT